MTSVASPPITILPAGAPSFRRQTAADKRKGPTSAGRRAGAGAWGRGRGRRRCCVGPDEEHGARGVVDHEARGGPQAARPPGGAIPVPCEDEQVHPGGGRDPPPLNAAPASLAPG